MLRFFPVILFSCCTFLCVAIFSSCTFSRVASCCTYFSLNFFRVVLIWSYSFSKLHFLHVFFILHLFFELHSFRIAPFFAWHSFDIVLHLFSWCTVVLFSCFIFFVLLHIAPCCILLQCCSSLSCTIFILYFFHTTVFSSWAFFVVHFSCRAIFRVAMFSCCILCALFSYCTFFRVWLFSCRTFFQFGPSLLTCFVLLFSWCPFSLLLLLSLRMFHITLFHIALVSCRTFFL